MIIKNFFDWLKTEEVQETASIRQNLIKKYLTPEVLNPYELMKKKASVVEQICPIVIYSKDGNDTELTPLWLHIEFAIDGSCIRHFEIVENEVIYECLELPKAIIFGDYKFYCMPIDILHFI